MDKRKDKPSIYKILSIKEWNNAKKTGLIKTHLDLESGFVHLSFPKQLEMTIKIYFSDMNEIILLKINTDIRENKLKYEANKNSKRKEIFPHLYSELRYEMIEKKWKIKGTSFKLPDEVYSEINQNL